MQPSLLHCITYFMSGQHAVLLGGVENLIKSIPFFHRMHLVSSLSVTAALLYI
jgi:hypothetical protein